MIFLYTNSFPLCQRSKWLRSPLCPSTVIYSSPELAFTHTMAIFALDAKSAATGKSSSLKCSVMSITFPARARIPSKGYIYLSVKKKKEHTKKNTYRNQVWVSACSATPSRSNRTRRTAMILTFKTPKEVLVSYGYISLGKNNIQLICCSIRSNNGHFFNTVCTQRKNVF